MKTFCMLALIGLASTLCAQEWMPVKLNNTPHSQSHSIPVGTGTDPENIFASVGDTTFIVANGGRVGEELFFLNENATAQLHTDFLRFKEKDDLSVEIAGNEASSYPQINQCSDHVMGIAATKLVIDDDNRVAYEYKSFQIDENNPQARVTPLFEEGTVVPLLSKVYGDANYAVFKKNSVEPPNLFIYNCKARQFSNFHINTTGQEAVNSRFYFYRGLDEATGTYFQSAFDFINKQHYSIPWAIDGVDMLSLSLVLDHEKGILYSAFSPAPDYEKVYLFWSPEQESFAKINFTKDDNIESSIRNLVGSLRPFVNIAVNSAGTNGVINCQVSSETGCFFFDLDNYHITKVAALEDMGGVSSSRIYCASKKPLEPDTYCSIPPLNSQSEIVKLNFDAQTKKLHVDLIGKVASQPLFLTKIRDKLYWFEEDEIIGKELVEADLSNVEERTQHDLNATSYAAEPKHFKKFGTELFFTANKGASPAQASKGSLEKYPTDVEIFSIDKNHRVRQVSNFHEKFYDIKHVDHSAESLLVTVPLIMSDASFADTVYKVSKASGESKKLLSLNDIRQTVEKIHLRNSTTAYAVLKEAVYAQNDLYYLITLDLAENKEVARHLILEANQTVQFRFFSDKLFWILSSSDGVAAINLDTREAEQHDLGTVTFVEEHGERIDEFFVQVFDNSYGRSLAFYSKENQRFISTNINEIMGIKRNGEDTIFYGGYFAYVFRPDKAYTVIFENNMLVNCITTLGDKLVVWGTHGRFPLETNSIEVHDLKTQSIDIYPTYDKQMHNCSASDQGVYGNVRETKSGNGLLSFQNDMAAVRIPDVSAKKLFGSYKLEDQNGLEQFVIESEDNGQVVLGKVNVINGKTATLWDFKNEILNPSAAKLNESTLGAFGMVNGFDSEAARFQLQTYNVINGMTKRFNWPGNWQDAQLIGVPDIDGDGIDEPTLVGRYIAAGNRPQAIVLSSINGEQLNRISFPPIFAFHQYLPIADHNFDGAGDIALWGKLERNGKTQVKIESISDDERLLNLNFPSKWAAKHLVTLQDINNDGYSDIALFAQNSEDTNYQLVVKSGTKDNLFTKVFSWPSSIQQGQFYSIPDLNADGIDEVSVFGIDNNAQRLKLVIKDGTESSKNLGNIGWPAEFEDYTLFVLRRPAEKPLAVLIARTGADKWRLDVKNVENKSVYRKDTTKNFSSIQNVIWVDNDAQHGISVLGIGENGEFVQEFVIIE